VSALTGALYINGRWRDGRGGAFASLAPHDQRTIWRGHAADAADIDEAFGAARAAFPDWADRPFEARAAAMRAFAAALKDAAEALARVLAEETGKPLWEARTEIAAMNTNRRPTSAATCCVIARTASSPCSGRTTFPGICPTGTSCRRCSPATACCSSPVS
jgi:hypothetical protein